jgi:UDP-GlcNAc:undecaprenyl-phosphate GlcNAc-1-phosphate transferase
MDYGYWGMSLFFVFLTALFVAMVSVAGCMRLAYSLDFVDLPDPRKVHTRPVPRVGGIGMVLGATAAVLAWLKLSPGMSAFLGGVAVISLFGLWDDKADLDYRAKFAGQCLAIGIVVGFGHVLIDRLPGFEYGTLSALVSYPLTVFFLLGTTNAINLSDGLDGLAAGLSFLSLACIAYLADLAGGGELIPISTAIMGSILGFLRYNTHPALVFMGDTGSQFLGFSLGVLVVVLTQQVNTALTPGLALMVLGLPIIDTLTVMAQRMIRGDSPFRPDRNHFHHKLLVLGFDHYEAVLAIYAIQMLFVVSACLLRYESYWIIAVYYLLLAGAIVFSYPLARRLGWRLHDGRAARISPLARVVGHRRSRVLLDRIAYRLVGYVITGFVLAGSIMAEGFERDLGYFAVAIAAVSLLVRKFRWPVGIWAERLAMYSCVILVIYSIEATNALADAECQDWLRYFFLLLALVVAVGMRFSGSYYFSVTPSDYLVMFILLAAANLPVFGTVNYAKVAAYSAVMLYGVEFVLRRRSFCDRSVWVGTMAAFLVVGVRAFL